MQVLFSVSLSFYKIINLKKKTIFFRFCRLQFN